MGLPLEASTDSHVLSLHNPDETKRDLPRTFRQRPSPHMSPSGPLIAERMSAHHARDGTFLENLQDLHHVSSRSTPRLPAQGSLRYHLVTSDFPLLSPTQQR